VHFAIASYSAAQAEYARQMVARGVVPVEVFVGRTPELIAAATCCLACSGSVSLELLYHATPAVIVYRVGWATYQVMRHLVNVRYITLVNLLASRQPLVRGLPEGPARALPVLEGEEQRGGSLVREPGEAEAWPWNADTAVGAEEPLLPEYPTWRDCSGEVAAHAIRWLEDEGARQQVVGRLRALRERLDRGEASTAAAEYLIRHIQPHRVEALPTNAATGVARKAG
jgi:lipid-A-disaccharide synthase